MKVIYPKYYYDFSCIAADCPDSCCQEWDVDVDADSAKFYYSLPGDLGNSLRRVLRDSDDGAIMTIQDGRCPMWRKDGLCRIHAELGHEALCKTCREFPRLRHDYGNFVEWGLELSCPEAARLILTHPGTLESTEIPGGEEPDYDPETMRILQQSRSAVLDYLDEDGLPVPLKLAVILVYAHHVQNWLDGGEEAAIDEASALNLLAQQTSVGDWESIIDFFLHLEILTERWRLRLETPAPESAWHGGYTALMRYFVLRYWLQAVADFDLIGRVKFMIVSCLLLYRLGGDFVETAQLFSKEIENDADNMNALWDAAYTDITMTDMNLLRLLKNG